MKRVKYLRLANGREPFRDWFYSLEISYRARIRPYIDRLAAGGGKKNIKSLGDGVFEIKMKFGSGYRIYFAEEDKTILLLLFGGDKSSQDRDIEKAKMYWREYVSKKHL
jgi:putative addiction module killer protein